MISSNGLMYLLLLIFVGRFDGCSVSMVSWFSSTMTLPSSIPFTSLSSSWYLFWGTNPFTTVNLPDWSIFFSAFNNERIFSTVSFHEKKLPLFSSQSLFKLFVRVFSFSWFSFRLLFTSFNAKLTSRVRFSGIVKISE